MIICITTKIIKMKFLDSFRESLDNKNLIYSSNWFVRKFSLLVSVLLPFCLLLFPIMLNTIILGYIMIYTPIFKIVKGLSDSNQILLLIFLSSFPSLLISKKIYIYIIQIYTDIDVKLADFTTKHVKTLLDIGLSFLAIRAILVESTYSDLTYTFVFAILTILFNNYINNEYTIDKKIEKLEMEINNLKMKEER